MLPCVKTLINLFHLLNHNIVREETVQCPLDRADIHPVLRLEVSYLAQGMNPRIGSSGTEQLDGFSCEKPYFFFEDPLDGRPLGLNLPSLIIRSIVFNQELNVSHPSFKAA